MSNVLSVSLPRDAGTEPGGLALEFAPPERIQTSVLAARERALLNWLCNQMPTWVTPDRLTVVGAIGAAIAGLGYAASNFSPNFLFVASLGVAINWFGDSLDGSLARRRGIERPRYGLFLDHSVDAINNLMLAIGLGLSPYVSMETSLFLLGGYYLLCIQVFLVVHVDSKFQLTYVFVGPTELRVVMIAFNCAIFGFGPLHATIAGQSVSVYSLLAAFEGATFVAVFVCGLYSTARRLRRLDDMRFGNSVAVNAAGRR